MENVKNGTWFEKQMVWFEGSRFGAMTLMMTFLSCFGSIGAMMSIMHHFYVGLVISAIVTMASNAAFIAEVSAKLCLGLFYVGLVVNAGVILANLFL